MHHFDAYWEITYRKLSSFAPDKSNPLSTQRLGWNSVASRAANLYQNVSNSVKKHHGRRCRKAPGRQAA
jgi:hypothetical protein